MGAVNAVIALVAYLIFANSAFAHEILCRPGIGPTVFNWDGGQLNFGNRRQQSGEPHNGKLALTVDVDAHEAFSIRMQKLEHSRGVNGCKIYIPYGINEKVHNHYTYFVDFPEGNYVIDEIEISNYSFFQTNTTKIQFSIVPGRVTYIGSYTFISDPVPIETKIFHLPLGRGGWRIDVADEQTRDFRTMDPENAYSSTIDNQVPRP